MKFKRLTLTHFRNRLGLTEAWPQLVILGLLSGLCTSLVILAFRFVVNWPLTHTLPNYSAENFEALSSVWHFFLPIIGSIIIALLMWKLHPDQARVGIPHILERLAYHQGRLPLTNAIVQFVGGALAILFGHSAGREGPAVHLGAATGSLLGQWFRLPNNCTRMLIGCGTAAAISASFNTPIAGVIFAMEVVMMEYTVIGFIPVIIAAITAALVMQHVYGNEIAFLVPPFELTSLGELPYIIFMGIVIGLLALLFNHTVLTTIKTVKLPLPARIMLAGLITGSVAVFSPYIMGLGYDTVSAILYGDILFGDMGLNILLVLVAAKLFVTAISIGLGMPMGLIGPTLVIGAAAGAALGLLGEEITQMQVSNIGFYAMMGMGAMMAAVLQAPLAAIMAVMELTHNSKLIFPAMAAVISASITCRYFFPHGSIFQATLQARGMDWRRAPLDNILENTNVTRYMHRLFSVKSAVIPRQQALDMLKTNVNWVIVLDAANQPESLVSIRDIEVYLASTEAQAPDSEGSETETESESESETGQNQSTIQNNVDLNAIPGLRYELTEIDRHATLREAQAKLDEHMVDALFITDGDNQSARSRHKAPSMLGILRRDDIIRFYTEPHPN